MEFILTVFFFLLILGFLIFIHELGHFLAAKITKVPVHEFAIGFGPKIFSKKYKGTKYQLRLFPLGGFVHLEGENSSENPLGFRNRSFDVKFFILIGGVFMNFITAIVFLAVYLSQNNNIFVFPNYADYNFTAAQNELSEYPVIVMEVNNEYGWENLTDRDVIISVNSQKINSIQQFQQILDENVGENLNVTTLDLTNLETTEKEIQVGGIKQDYFRAKIVSLMPDSVLQDKLSTENEIVGVNGTFFKSRSEFFELLNVNQGEKVVIQYLEDESVSEVSVTLPEKDASGAILKASIGFQDGLEYVPYSDSEKEIYFVKYGSSLNSVSLSYDLSLYQFKVIGTLLGDAFSSGDFREVGETFGSPVAVGSAVNNVVQYQVFEAFIPLIAFISLSLAIFNVLPIPALDGGQITIAFIELILRRRLSDKVVGFINLVGFTFLITLSLVLIFKDLIQFQVFSKSAEFLKDFVGR